MKTYLMLRENILRAFRQCRSHGIYLNHLHRYFYNNHYLVSYRNFYSKATIVMAILSIGIGLTHCQKKEKTNQQKKQYTAIENAEEIFKSEQNSNYILPRPTTIFELLEKKGFKFQSFHIEKNSEVNYNTYVKRALNLGMRATDALFAFFAEDFTFGKDIAQSTILISKTLGIEQDISAAVRKLQVSYDDKIMDLSPRNRATLEHLDQVFASVEHTLKKSANNELAILVSLGGWIESLYLITKELSINYDAVRSRLLIQSEVISVYLQSLTEMQQDVGDTDTIPLLIKGLKQIQQTFPTFMMQPLEQAKVEKILIITRKLKKQIVSLD